MKFVGPAGYVGVFTVLVACGLGLPMPEDISLIAGGYLAGLAPHRNLAHPTLFWMIVTGLAGIMVGDSIIFKAGGTYGDKLLETRLGKHIPAERVVRIRELFAKHGPKMIMVARFLPGIRAVTYFVAGTSRVPYWKFFAYDFLAALVSAPLWVLLGHWAGREHKKVAAFAAASKVQVGILIVAGVGILAGVAWWYFKKRRARALERKKLLEASTMEPAALEHGPARAEVPAPRPNA